MSGLGPSEQVWHLRRDVCVLVMHALCPGAGNQISFELIPRATGW